MLQQGFKSNVTKWYYILCPVTSCQTNIYQLPVKCLLMKKKVLQHKRFRTQCTKEKSNIIAQKAMKRWVTAGHELFNMFFNYLNAFKCTVNVQFNWLTKMESLFSGHTWNRSKGFESFEFPCLPSTSFCLFIHAACSSTFVTIFFTFKLSSHSAVAFLSGWRPSRGIHNISIHRSSQPQWWFVICLGDFREGLYQMY